MQVWERNLITSNTIIGIHTINLYEWLMLTYKRIGVEVKPFQEKRAAIKRLESGDVRDGDINENYALEKILGGDDDAEDDAEDEDEDMAAVLTTLLTGLLSHWLTLSLVYSLTH
jgi:hypothetical protein